jgi:hypothetical protein
MNIPPVRRFRFKTTFNFLGVNLSYMTLDFIRFQPELVSVQLKQPPFDNNGRELPLIGTFSALLRSVEEVDREDNVIVTTEEILTRYKAGRLV